MNKRLHKEIDDLNARTDTKHLLLMVIAFILPKCAIRSFQYTLYINNKLRTNKPKYQLGIYEIFKDNFQCLEKKRYEHDIVNEQNIKSQSFANYPINLLTFYRTIHYPSLKRTCE